MQTQNIQVVQQVPQFDEQEIFSFKLLKLIYMIAYQAEDDRLRAEATSQGVEQKKPTDECVKDGVRNLILKQKFLNNTKFCELIYSQKKLAMQDRLAIEEYGSRPEKDESKVDQDRESVKLPKDVDVFGTEDFKDSVDVLNMLDKCLEVFVIIKEAAKAKLTPIQITKIQQKIEKEIEEERAKEEQAKEAVKSLKSIIHQYQLDNGLLDDEAEEKADDRKKTQHEQCKTLKKILVSNDTDKLVQFRKTIQQYKQQQQVGLLAHRHPGYDKFENFLRVCSCFLVLPAAVYLYQGSLWKRTSGEVMLDKSLDIINKKYTK